MEMANSKLSSPFLMRMTTIFGMSIAFDGMSGEVILDLPGHYLSGMADVDGDGVTELFCTAVTGSVVPASASAFFAALAESPN